MDEYYDTLDFCVTICLGGGDGGDVCVSVDVTEKEYRNLQANQGIVEDGSALYERIKEEAISENEDCLDEMDSDEEIDYDCASFIIELVSAIDEWEDYDGYPFAIEVVNGEILSMTVDIQESLREKIREALQMSDEDLAEFLVSQKGKMPWDGRCEDDKISAITECAYDALAEILGFDESTKTFSPEGIGFLESEYGWEARDLLEEFGFELEEDITPGPHGHGTYGVIYISEEDSEKN